MFISHFPSLPSGRIFPKPSSHGRGGGVAIPYSYIKPPPPFWSCRRASPMQREPLPPLGSGRRRSAERCGSGPLPSSVPPTIPYWPLCCRSRSRTEPVQCLASLAIPPSAPRLHLVDSLGIAHMDSTHGEKGSAAPKLTRRGQFRHFLLFQSPLEKFGFSRKSRTNRCHWPTLTATGRRPSLPAALVLVPPSSSTGSLAIK